MSFGQDDIQNKMMTTPPAKKGFHFTSDGLHFAEFIEAETIEEATAIYHKIRRAFSQSPITTTAPEPPAEQSTAPLETEEDALG